MGFAGESVLEYFKTLPIGVTPVYVSKETLDVPYAYCQGFIFKRSGMEGQILLNAAGGIVIYTGYFTGSTTSDVKLTWRKLLTEIL